MFITGEWASATGVFRLSSSLSLSSTKAFSFRHELFLFKANLPGHLHFSIGRRG